MYKKVLVVTVLAVAVLTAGYAQGQFKFGARAGLNFTNMKFEASGISISPKMKPGIQLGLVGEYGLSESLFFQPGILFAQQGCKLDGKLFGESGEFKLTLNYVQVPLNFQFKTDVGGALLLLQAGPYGGIGVSGKYKYDKESEDVEFGDSGDFKTFDLGLGIGAGLQFDNIQVGIGYNIGLADISTESGLTNKNSGLTFTLTYFFGK